MKKILLSTLIIISLVIISGCSNNTIKEETTNNVEEERSNDMNITNNIKVTINNKEYIAQIENNETAQAFINHLPEEFNMSELNGNEKYIYMGYTLPTNHTSVKHIEAGDIMLYGNNCLVIFYKSFDTPYSYTKIGHITNLPNLGQDDITAKFNY